jgi:threonine dehydratase
MRLVKESSAEVKICCTPLIPYSGDPAGWRNILLKDETKQTTGSFKFRSVFKKLRSLETGLDFVTASTGNHGLAVAATSMHLGRNAHVFVPACTPTGKVQALRTYGANVIEVEGDYDVCVLTAKSWALANSAMYVESFEDPGILEGHRSLLEEIDGGGYSFDICIVPVGGGGLLASSLRHWEGSGKKVVGVEAECAPVMALSLLEGRPVHPPISKSIAEGIALPSIGVLPFEVCRALPPQLVNVTEQEICQAIQLLWKHNRIKAEGAGAAALAGALKISGEARTCVCIISGGNIDPSQFEAVISNPTAS